jgi:hypothetical protein
MHQRHARVAAATIGLMADRLTPAVAPADLDRMSIEQVTRTASIV